MILAAQHEHQCILCLAGIYTGDYITDIAEDLLSGHLVFTHLSCGDNWLEHHPDRPKLLSTGWEILKGEQKCEECKRLIPAGRRAFRAVNAGDGYDRICQLCWMRRILGA